jgi:hypothetical protein
MDFNTALSKKAPDTMTELFSPGQAPYKTQGPSRTSAPSRTTWLHQNITKELDPYLVILGRAHCQQA